MTNKKMLPLEQKFEKKSDQEKSKTVIFRNETRILFYALYIFCMV